MKPSSFFFVLGFTVAAQAAALAFTLQLAGLADLISFEPVQGAQAPVFNAVIFLTLPILGSLIYLKFRHLPLLKYAYALAEALLVAFLSFLVLVFSDYDILLAGLLSFAVGSIGLAVLIYGRGASRTAFSLLLSSEAGAYLALVFKPPTIYVVLLLFALYDVFAVFKGPLRKVVADPSFGALSVDFGSISMGMGDEIFYAMVPSAAYLIRGPLAAVAIIAIIDAGVAITLLLLSRRRALPGLTLPLLFSLAYFAVLAVV